MPYEHLFLLIEEHGKLPLDLKEIIISRLQMELSKVCPSISRLANSNEVLCRRPSVEEHLSSESAKNIANKMPFAKNVFIQLAKRQHKYAESGNSFILENKPELHLETSEMKKLCKCGDYKKNFTHTNTFATYFQDHTRKRLKYSVHSYKSSRLFGWIKRRERLYDCKEACQKICTENKTCKCGRCEMSIKQKRELMEHKKIRTGNDGSVHTTELRNPKHLEKMRRKMRLRHPTCNSGGVTLMSSLTFHKEGHAAKKPRKCGSCDMSFTQKSSLAVHERIHMGVKPYEESFTWKDNLFAHEALHARVYHYKCSTFGKSFTQKHNHRVHKKRHTGELLYKCATCCKSFTKKSRLTVHERIHTGEKPYTCTTCGKSFRQKGSLMTHRKHHTGEQPYKCGTCDKGFIFKNSLLIHERAHKGEKPYTCAICDKSFTEKNNLMSHERLHTGQQLYKCVTCNKNFTKKSNLTVHERIHTGEKPYKCATCSKSFTKKSTLTGHEKMHIGGKPYKCAACGKCFTRKYTLLDHEKLHTGEMLYKCGICSKSFTKMNKLTVHERVHTGEKPYKCATCSKSFTKKETLSVHEKMHTGEKPHKCTACGKRFTAKLFLTCHERIHTGEKPYTCTICGKSYTQKGSLMTHGKIHTGEQPFKCATCGKSFTLKSCLKVHDRTHTGERPFICAICGKCFAWKNSLMRHQKLHDYFVYLFAKCDILVAEGLYTERHINVARDQIIAFFKLFVSRLYFMKHYFKIQFSTKQLQISDGIDNVASIMWNKELLTLDNSIKEDSEFVRYKYEYSRIFSSIDATIIKLINNKKKKINRDIQEYRGNKAYPRPPIFFNKLQGGTVPRNTEGELLNIVDAQPNLQLDNYEDEPVTLRRSERLLSNSNKSVNTNFNRVGFSQKQESQQGEWTGQELPGQLQESELTTQEMIDHFSDPLVLIDSKGDFKIYNYTSFVIDPELVEFFSKGLTFVPDTRLDLVRTIIDLKLFIRKLNLKLLMGNDTIASSSLRVPSVYNPPLHETLRLFEKMCEFDLRALESEKLFHRRPANITKHQREFLGLLKNWYNISNEHLFLLLEKHGELVPDVKECVMARLQQDLCEDFPSMRLADYSGICCQRQDHLNSEDDKYATDEKLFSKHGVVLRNGQHDCVENGKSLGQKNETMMHSNAMKKLCRCGTYKINSTCYGTVIKCCQADNREKSKIKVHSYHIIKNSRTLEGNKRREKHKECFVVCQKTCAKKKSYRCFKCRKGFIHKCQLMRHKKIHSGEKTKDLMKLNHVKNVYKCVTCDKCFTTKHNLKVHKAVHKRKKTYRCSTCEESFTKKHSLIIHEKSHGGKKPYKCATCGKNYAHKGSLTVHQKIHGGEKPYKCATCGKGFIRRYIIAIHEKIHSGNMPYKCKICNKSFMQRNHLTDHERIHTGEKPFKCATCDKSFIQKNQLTVHERIHTGEKPYKCSACDKSFTQKYQLTVHERIHKGEKPYKCATCDQSFRVKHQLTVHKRIHTREKPYKCTECDQSFATKHQLTAHGGIHSKEKPYKCEICSKNFTLKSYLTSHEKIHTGDRPHKCTTCGKSFLTKRYLKCHERTHTDDKVLHWGLYKQYNIQVVEEQWEREPERITKNEGLTSWDYIMPAVKEEAREAYTVVEEKDKSSTDY
ncbi:zinc finger protein 850-like [Protopterus annectens]|uniref:zinc finger protein 850-like n=1 Tax=Protopterus annectens TaxID=7888 RepID=UPI001CFAB4EC|nr:zinc finger protein 850-like [Protopterus annectens]